MLSVSSSDIFQSELIVKHIGKMMSIRTFKIKQCKLAPIVKGLFQQFNVCDNRKQSPALFRNIFKFCAFLPKFSNALNFLIFFGFFLKNPRHALTFWNRPAVTVLCTCNFTYMIVRAKPLYMHENQCSRILNLSSPEDLNEM